MSTLNHAETRNLVIICSRNIEQNVVLPAIFFAHLKVNDVKDKMLTDIFEFSTPKLCKNKRKKIICTQMSSKVQCFLFQHRLNTHIFKKNGCNILAFKNIYEMYKSKYHSILSKYTSEFRKHK